MRIRHTIGSAFPGGYSAGELAAWPAGEEREVLHEQADYLLHTFPCSFEPVIEPEPEPEPEPVVEQKKKRG